MTISHGGFIVPNAEGLASTKMAEPDQVDFNTLGNARWGVVSGCSVSVVGSVASIATSGIAVVDGVVVNVNAGQSVTLGAGGSQPRFDLIGVNSAGTIVSIPGTPAADPVFPDVPASATLLAAVFCPAGSSQFDIFVSDKRKILSPVAVSTASGTTPILLNRYNGTDTFRVDSTGRLEWNNSDTYLYRTGAESVRIHSHLTLDGTLLTDGSATIGGDADITGTLRSNNLRKLADGSAFPNAPQGTLLQLNGKVFIQTAATAPMVWEQVVTASATHLPGDIKQSMRSPSQMPGWIPMDGSTITEVQYPQLFDVGGLTQFIVPGSPRVMILPDATDRTLLPTTNNPGKTGGSSTVTILLNNLPSHVHGVSIAANGGHDHSATTAENGAHDHSTVTTGANGRHRHAVTDPGHSHNGAEGWGGLSGWAFIAVAWGGRNKLDGPINDSSHTYSVEPMQRTASATTGVRVEETDSEHQHQTTTAGQHGHLITIGSAPNHVHAVSENAVGGNAPINITPKYLTVYTYIKV